jgi:hypothetical protein
VITISSGTCWHDYIHYEHKVVEIESET